jgi:ornithine carbamoyltransferase
MSVDLRRRSFVAELDFTADELRYLIGLAADLKAAAKSGVEHRHLAGRKIALIFEKTSTMARCAFETAAYAQGAQVTFLGPEGSQIGHKESVKDAARVLGRMYDAIEYLGLGQKTVEELARYAGVPVYNGLSDEFHPMHMLADMLTMREHSAKPPESIAYCFVGDARFNTGNSLMITGAKLGMDVRICAPRSLWPDPVLVDTARVLAKESGARLTLTEDIPQAVRQADYLYTDAWVPMGEDKAVWAERIALLRPYQVNQRMIDLTGNPEVRFMHCLPAFHDRRTRVREQIFEESGLDSLEVTDEVFESERSVVFDQAENQMHTIKAVLVATLGD